MQASTPHLTVSASISDAVAAPGERLSIAVDVTPRRGMHLYAPGKHYSSGNQRRVTSLAAAFAKLAGKD